jgi:hypothetical protein
MNGMNADRLADEITQELARTSDVPTALMAGHRILASSDRYSDAIGVFPDTTWKIGKKIVGNVRSSMSDIRLFSMINDWSHIRGRAESVDVIRARYWNDPAMEIAEVGDPTFAPHLLDGHGHGSKPVKGRMSEQWLQNEYSRMRGRSDDLKMLLQDEEEQAGCSLGGCASEYVALIPHLYRRNIRRLISFVPNVCEVPVEAGSHAIASIGASGLLGDMKEPFTIRNIYLNAHSPANEGELFSRYASMEHVVSKA